MNSQASHHKRHTVLITSPAGQGGVASFVKTLEKEFQSSDQYKFIIHTIGSAHHKSLLLKLLSLPLDLLRFWQAIKRYQPTLVHINPSFKIRSIIRDGMLTRIAQQNNYPLLISFHGWNSSIADNALVRWFVRRTFFTASLITVLASRFRNQLQGWGFKNPIAIGKVPYQLPYMDEFYQDHQQYNSNFQLLFLARLVKEKGIYELLQSFEELKPKYPHITLVIAGDGPEHENIQQWINTHGLEKSIAMAGYVKGYAKEQLFAESQIYVLPSYTEGLPITMIEALAYGLPVVVTAVGGIPDVLSTQNGCFAKIGDPTSLTECLATLIKNPDKCSSIAQRNRVLAKEQFSPLAVANNYEQYYSSVLQKEQAGQL